MFMSIHGLQLIPAEASVMCLQTFGTQWFHVGKFALKEAISQHVLVDVLSVYDVSRTSVLTAHQFISFNHQLLAERPHLP